MSDAGFVLFGAGNMGGAIAEGWLAAHPGAALTIIDPKPNARVKAWAGDGRAVLNPEPFAADVLMIAVKPQLFAQVTGALRDWTGPDTRVMSIMAGVTLKQLTQALGTDRVIRLMPNTPGAIGHGVCLLSPGEGASKQDIADARALLAPLGHVEGPMSEAVLQAATGLSSSGPAFVFLLAEVMAAAAERQGVPAEMAARLAVLTIDGSARLMTASTEPPAELRRAVTSPNGVTQAALDVLMGDRGMPSLFRDALAAVVARDRALSAPREKD